MAHSWKFVHLVAGMARHLEVFARGLKGEDLPEGLRLKFRRNADHPYGQLLWVWTRGRVSFSRLTERQTRMARIGSRGRKAIARIERQRRPLIRRLGRLTRLLKKIRMKTLRATRKAEGAMVEAVRSRTPQIATAPFEAR
jgi:hypothetical protein